MTGYVKVGAAVPSVRIADCRYNADSIIRLTQKMDGEGVVVAVFPEMCVTGYTCADLFHNFTLLDGALEALNRIAEATEALDITVIVGLPVSHDDTLYNVAAVVGKGAVMGLVPKTYIPNYNEFYEKRWWASAPARECNVDLGRLGIVVMSNRQIFSVNGFKFGVEICEDLWTPVTPGSLASLAGAEVIFNLSASDALIGKYDYIKSLVNAQSARCIGGYVYASAGFGESSTDLVFDGITLISDNGRLIESGTRWHGDEYFIQNDIDLAAIRHDRMTVSSFADSRKAMESQPFRVVAIADVHLKEQNLRRYIAPRPFVPSDEAEKAKRCDEIINIQVAGLAQRLNATNTRNIVVGVSGGLDSTLALLVAVRTFDRLGLDRKGIHAITMPGFGTTDHTYRNAVNLIGLLGLSFREISIAPAVRQHFSDIGHDENRKDVTYENSQARQRTLLLMDIANQVGGMVLGTGDLSELALGWATYNGDHMSMYGVNTGVPKTLVKYLVSYFAETDKVSPVDNASEGEFKETLRSIIDTPISPELIPADENGNISQKTEDLVGPYELHDFFLYYTLRYGLGPRMIFERAVRAFEGVYDGDVIIHWLTVFCRRFFNQQFKRSCLPDGPKVGSVCLSPRGDWRMPSDASNKGWMEELELIVRNR